MKRIYYIVACLLTLLAVLPANAQEQATTQNKQQQQKGPRASRGGREATKADN